MIHSFCIVSSINFYEKMFYVKYRDIIIKYVTNENPRLGDVVVFETFNHMSQQEGYYQVADYFAALMYYQMKQGLAIQLHYPIQAPHQRSLTTSTHRGVIYRLTVTKNFRIRYPQLVTTTNTDLQRKLLRLWLAANSTENSFYQNLFYWQFLVFPHKKDCTATRFINEHADTLEQETIRPIFEALCRVAKEPLCPHNLGEFIQHNIKNNISHFVRNNGYMLEWANLDTMHLFALSRDLLHHFCLLKLEQEFSSSTVEDVPTCRLLTKDEVLELEKKHNYY